MNTSPAALALEQARRDLLDLGINRNSLLNYRTSARFGVEIVGERSADVYRILVTDQKAMNFLPAKRRAGEAAEADPEARPLDEVSDDEIDLPEGEDRYTDRNLQTRYGRDGLHARLRLTSEESQTHLEEQGVNILYLALGFLHWRDHNNDERRAPLLLIPAALERASVSAKYAVRWSRDDIGNNLTLTEKLRVDHAIELPAFDDQESFDPAAYLALVTERITHLPEWSVAADELALGFFSFGKFLMYRDLDARNWPEDAQPYEHPIIEGILGAGFGGDGVPMAPDEPLDRIHQPSATTEVVDADSSQAQVLTEVARSRHVVIQGPPGTGKSQTITNLIAAAVVAGKKVLFVAEKMAALEVVKRRMDAAGIGDCALELHSHKSSKKVVLGELKRVLDLGEPMLGSLAASAAALSQSRDRLNAYCQAVSEPVAASCQSPFQLMGGILGIDQAGAVPRLPFAPLANLSADTFAANVMLVEELERVVQRLGRPVDHPWYGITRTAFLPSELDALHTRIAELHERIDAFIQQGSELAETLGWAAPVDVAQAQQLIVGAELLTRMPPGTEMLTYRDPAWSTRALEITVCVEAGSSYRQLRAVHDAHLIPEAWTQDLMRIRTALKASGTSWLRMLSGDYRRARAHLFGLCTGVPPATLAERLVLVDAVMTARRYASIMNDAAGWMAPLAGARWQGLTTAWADLTASAAWLAEAHRVLGERRVPAAYLQDLARARAVEGLSSRQQVYASALKQIADEVRALARDLEWEERAVGRAPAPEVEPAPAVSALTVRPFADIVRQLATWKVAAGSISEYLTWLRQAQACQEVGLGHLLPLAETWPHTGQRLVAALRRSWFLGWLDRAHKERSALANFDQTNHEAVVERFRDAERLTFDYHRARVALHHWQGLPAGPGGVGQLGILRKQVELKSRQLPIRQLLTQAPQAVQATKPVFMMSPMSVATFLAPEGPQFDLVVFDEASQVRPVDALGSLMRGKQAVVVGDSKQMPPSSFFDRIMTSDNAQDDDVELAATADVESVLGLMKSKGVPSRMLRWHYRSHHPSLIAVSNHLFYDGQLIVCPSPLRDIGPTTPGLALRHLPDTVYDRGGTCTNPGEASAVAQAIMDHARATPQRTLGVVAFSVAQRHAIDDALTSLRRADPSCEGFFSSHPHEPFVIKNLENVQGDERDVIFISIGYGKNAEGYLAMQFGPLSGPGGERRLNVLISRARYRCEVFTNLLADDIVLERTQAVGVRSLRTFLHYARTGILDALTAAADRFDSPFEEAVAMALRRIGHEVHTQVGSAGFRIDLAVVDPQHPGRYLLGIECDGATYHGAAWARDRDRLREQVLRNQGWSIHRIWSTSWFINPDEQLRLVSEAIARAAARGEADWRIAQATPATTGELPRQPSAAAATGTSSAAEGQTSVSASASAHSMAGAGASSAPRQASAVHEVARDPRRTRSTTSLVRPYQVAREVFSTTGEVRDAPAGSIAPVLARIVGVESPIHRDELIRRFVQAAGASRAGARIQEAAEAGLQFAIAKGSIFQRGNFCWKPGMDRAPVRYRADLAGKRIDLVAPEELAEALILTVKEHYGAAVDDLPRATAKMLGFPGLTEEWQSLLVDILNELVRTGRLVIVGSEVRVA